MGWDFDFVQETNRLQETQPQRIRREHPITVTQCTAVTDGSENLPSFRRSGARLDTRPLPVYR